MDDGGGGGPEGGALMLMAPIGPQGAASWWEKRQLAPLRHCPRAKNEQGGAADDVILNSTSF